MSGIHQPGIQDRPQGEGARRSRVRGDFLGKYRTGGDSGNPYGSWRGAVFILASGPSANQEDARKAKEKGRVIAVNCAIRLCPDADALYAADHQWWKKYEDDWRDFRGLRFSINKQAVQEYGCIYVPIEAKEGLGRKGVATCSNSGYQATNLAWLLGAEQIFLIGFDMKPKDGVHHFHGNHQGLGNPTPNLYDRWIRGFANIHKRLKAEGVELINCSRDTALTIPRANLEDVLSGLGR